MFLDFFFRSAQELNEMTLRRSCPKGCFAGRGSVGGVSGRRSLHACHKISSKSLSFMDTLDTYNFPKLQKIFSSMASIESACILKGTLPVATPLRLHKHWWHYCNLSQPQVHLPKELVNCMKSNLKVETSLWASRKFGKNMLKCHKIYWNAETEFLPPRNWYHWATPLPPAQIQWRLIRLSFGQKTQYFI